MRRILAVLAALAMVACGGAPDAPGSAQGADVQPSGPAAAHPGVAQALAPLAKLRAECRPETVACQDGFRAVCNGDARWASLPDLPACSTECSAATGRFVVDIYQNATFDSATGLEWMWRAGQGPATCASYGSGFRLPTEAELTSTAPNGACSPNVDQAAFADQSDFYLASDGKYYDARAGAFVTSLPYGEQAYSRCVR